MDKSSLVEKSIEKKEYQQSKENIAQTEALLESVSAVLEHQDFTDAVKVIFYACKDLIGAKSGYVSLFTKNGARNNILLSEMEGAQCSVDPSLIGPPQGLRKKVFELGKPLYDNDFANSQWADIIPRGHLPIENVLYTPMLLKGQVVGLLGFANKPEGFSHHDAELAGAFGKFSAVAYNNSLVLESLENREEQFRSVTQTANDAVICANSKGELVLWNKAAEIIFGYKAHEVIGKSLTFLIPKDNRKLHSEVLKNRVYSGKQKMTRETAEVCGIKKDGSEVPLEISLSSWRARGETFFTGIIRDITKRKEMEYRLEESEQYYKSLFEYNSDAVFSLDLKGKLTSANPALKKITGFTGDELIDKNIFSLIIVNDLVDVVKHFEKTVQRQSESIEISIKHKRGHIVEVNVQTVPIVINGKVVGIYCIAKDITEEKRSAEALEASEQRFRKAFEHAAIGMSWVNPEGYFIKVNNYFSEMLGYSMEELLTKSITDITHLDDVARQKEYSHRLIVGEIESFQMEKRYIHKEGHVVWTQINSSLVRDFAGKPLHFIGQIQDITERKRMEDDLIKTTKLEAVGLLAGGIAHDFNNILTIILGNISLLKLKNNKDTKQVAKLTEIEKATLEAKGLTQQLLTFAKGGAPLKKIVPIKELIKDATSMSLSGSNVKYELDIDQDLKLVEVDEGQINQVLNNIILNAKQAMPRGGKIRVRAKNCTIREDKDKKERALKAGEYVRIKIKDNGKGIPKENFKKIFDPYFTTKEAGHGLGLATSYSIIKKHNGYIWINSKKGKGTTFYIFLPSADSQKQTEKIEEAKSISGRGKVLIMDDEEKIREIVGQMLTYLGYEVEVAQEGAEALELYKEAKRLGQRFDVVILDLTIRGAMGGKETIKNLQKIDPKVKAIVASGYSDDAVMARFSEHGFRAFLAKPVKMEDLSQTIDKVMRE